MSRRWFRPALSPLFSGSLSKWTLFSHRQTSWKSCGYSRGCPYPTREQSSARGTIRNLSVRIHRRLSLRSSGRLFDSWTKTQERSLRPSVLYESVSTFRIDWSSTVGIEQVEGFLYFQHLFLCETRSLVGFRIEFVALLGTFLHSNRIDSYLLYILNLLPFI